MGTSSAFGGQNGGTPLIPSWLDDGGTPPAPNGVPPDGGPPNGPPQDVPAPGTPPAPPARPPIPPVADSTRFSAARNNLSRFAGSGGNDRRSLGIVKRDSENDEFGISIIDALMDNVEYCTENNYILLMSKGLERNS